MEQESNNSVGANDQNYLKKLGSESDLFLLRQVNETFQQKLNSTYIDVSGKIMYANIIRLEDQKCRPIRDKDYFEDSYDEQDKEKNAAAASEEMEIEEVIMSESEPEPENGGAETNDDEPGVGVGEANIDNQQEQADANSDLDEHSLNEDNFDEEERESEDYISTDSENGDTNSVDDNTDWKIQVESKDGKCEKKITFENWNPEIAYIFRELRLGSYSDEESEEEHALDEFSRLDDWQLKKDGLNVNQVVAQVAPYITILSLDAHLPQRLGKPQYRLTTFLNQFLNLKDLTLTWTDYELSLKTLAVVLDNLKSKPFITLLVLAQHEEVLDKFGTKVDMRFILKNLQYPIDEFQNISNKFGHLKNIKYFIPTSQFSNDTLTIDKLETLAALCVKHENDVEEVKLSVMDFEDEWAGNVQRFNQCLTELSSFLADLQVQQFKKIKKDLLNTEADFPKLKKLTISGYENRLEILKKCPKLKTLLLINVNEDSCFVSDNPQQSKKDSLAKYFSNLKELEELDAYDVDITKSGEFDLKYGGKKAFRSLLNEILPTIQVGHDCSSHTDHNDDNGDEVND